MKISKVLEILTKLQKEVGDVDVELLDDENYSESIRSYSVKTTHLEDRDTHELKSTTVVILES